MGQIIKITNNSSCGIKSDVYISTALIANIAYNAAPHYKDFEAFYKIEQQGGFEYFVNKKDRDRVIRYMNKK